MELSLDEVEVEVSGRSGRLYEVEVEVKNSGAEEDLKALAEVLQGFNADTEKTSKLERALDLTNSPEPPPVDPGRQEKKRGAPKRNVRLKAGESMRKAGVKSLRFHYARLLKSESGTRKGKNIESLHRMRVATRRLRSILKSFGPHLPKKEVSTLSRELKEATRLLGRVRDFDVLLNHLRSYLRSLPKPGRKHLDPLRKSWEEPRDKARKELMAYFDGKRYKALNRACERLIERGSSSEKTTGRKGPSPVKLVRHAVPRLLWKKYENVRCYETVLEGAAVDVYHQLRIECKRFRYTLELFWDVLGETGEGLVEIVTAAQEHLGQLQDADVAIGFIEALLKRQSPKASGKPLSAESRDAIRGYLCERKAKQEHQIQTFPGVWSRLVESRFAEELARVLGAL